MNSRPGWCVDHHPDPVANSYVEPQCLTCFLLSMMLGGEDKTGVSKEGNKCLPGSLPGGTVVVEPCRMVVCQPSLLLEGSLQSFYASAI